MVMAAAREENGEFCVAVAPATRTAGVLTQSAKGGGCVKLSRPSSRSGQSRRTGCCGTFLSLSNRHRGMDGQQPATPEPNKDSGHMDGFYTATKEDRHRGNTGDVVNRSDRGHGARSWESSLIAASQ